jgi:DNA-binding transcriptional LysR family regulator
MGAPLDLDDLELLLRVVDLGSFAAAARATGVDPSLVSRRVSALEAAVGARLLHRTTRALSLTEAGRAWVDRVGPAVRAIRDAHDELLSSEAAVRGTVRVAAPGALGRRRVAPALCALLHAHPALDVDLRLSDLRLDLAEGGVDLAVRVGEPRDPGVVVRRLGLSPQVFVAAPALPLPDPLTLEGLPVVLRIEGGARLDALPSGQRPGWRVRLAADDVEAAADAIERGLGVGMLPAWLAEEALAAGRLRLVPAPFAVPPAPIVALLPAGRQAPRRVRVVLEALVREFGG